MSGRKKTKTIAESLVLLLVVVAPFVSGQENSQPIEPASSRERPLVAVDVRKFGYKPRGSGLVDPLSLAFTESNQLLVAWAASDDSRNWTKEPSTTPAPSHLHSVVLDARTGEVEHSGEWPSRYVHAIITPVGKEHFLICAVDEIRLLSNDFTTIRDQFLPAPVTCRGMRLSPSRHSFSLTSGLDHHVMDAESFQPLAEWSSKDATHVIFTDALLVGACGPDFDLCTREFNQQWQPSTVVGMKQSLKMYGTVGPTLLNDTALSIANGGKMVVVTLEGSILLHVTLPRKFLFARIATSTGGNRFAYIEAELRGSRALDMSSDFDDHIVVYDLTEKKAIYTRKVNGGSLWIPPFEHWNRIAVSADGTLLAILDDGIIEIYQLPDRES